MSRDIVKTRPAVVSKADLVKPSALTTPEPSFDIGAHTQPIHRRAAFIDFETTLPMTLPTDYLLGHHTEIHAGALSYSESVPVLEEAAILFASGQNDVAEQMLSAAVHHQQLGNATEIGWQMLFDLYRITGNQHMFESLSLDYANKFETSPPLWPEYQASGEMQDDIDASAAIPSVIFPVKLDSSIVKLLEKLQLTGSKSQQLRLDFSRVKQVDPVACGLLLRILRNFKKSKHDLMLVGAQDLAEKIRSILQVGRRDETEAPWLLLLEILQLLHFERAFEEASMDYCITFEVSPPSFEAPQMQVTTSFPSLSAEPQSAHADCFLMPASIEGKLDSLLARLLEQAEHYNPLRLDCSRLERVEFGASAELLNGLAPIAAQSGMVIQFEEVNYLVMMLFNAMGLKNIASITLRKH
ncbi:MULTISPECIES: hypothetical protein [unclassified Undibacterium]|uniref:hypothetical protein n=1 Tax=unclassified Undibacterium TaxID=2630295 RepID=UPI002AC98393|nr:MULTISPECIES: hypothetical protein [unclassified Undibacterium]MEB0139976.1 hypothetical protein [Undibacterium sp. CCC2.1]MEB0172949.1 hypothetical protein [Undibacterium sp. CCC1.1]MEB0176776.1 hypothetical protein [Undibacterium sp. CCC3.4]MEB0216877.1 hypothetical protein [Undibacterium sp. 5I2]WPX45015.1 hypothetical protein RHM61_07255 [Undibacterium sp. CCC3.4]